MGKVKEQAVAYSAKKKITKVQTLTKPKRAVSKLLRNLKDDVTYEDIMYEIYVLEKAERGLRDIKDGRIVSHEEVKQHVKKWLK